MTRLVVLFAAVTIGCGSQTGGVRQSLPRVGMAVADTLRAWCAEFRADSAASPLEPGQGVTIVFPGDAPIASLPARLGAPRPGECWAAFPQPRWIDYTAYHVDLLDSTPAGAQLPIVALIVTSAQSWQRDSAGAVADLDGDGSPEQVRRCTADEGEHFTLWSREADGRWTRRWHEYYDWGGFTDPTCRLGEDGRDTTGGSER
jgi:hypothetical protein